MNLARFPLSVSRLVCSVGSTRFLEWTPLWAVFLSSTQHSSLSGGSILLTTWVIETKKKIITNLIGVGGTLNFVLKGSQPLCVLFSFSVI